MFDAQWLIDSQALGSGWITLHMKYGEIWIHTTHCVLLSYKALLANFHIVCILFLERTMHGNLVQLNNYKL